MKLSRLPAVGAAFALVAASTLFVVTPAAADDFFYDQDDFGQEALPPSTYPVGVDWFYGAQPVNPLGDLDWSVSGIEINNGTNPSGAVQILNQNVTTPAAGGLAVIVDGAQVISDTGEWTFQLPLFANPAVGPQAFTTLRPAVAGNAGLSPLGDWITSRPIPDNAGGVAYAAGATATLAQFEAALNALASWELLAFGLNFTAADTDTIHAVEWNTDWSIFTPQPAASATPTSLSLGDFSNPSKGVTVTAGGFIPGETVLWFVEYPNGDSIEQPDVVADASGVATLHFVGTPTAALGTYVIRTFSEYTLNFDEFWFSEASFEVTANALAATGVDASGAGLAAGLLLVTGLGVVLLRRRAATQL